MQPASTPPVEDTAPAKRPFYKDPFIMAFVVGVIVLTVLPFLQKRFLKAPAPILELPAWSLERVSDAGVVSSASLAGHVVLLEVAPAPCDASCFERQASFGKALGHTDDLKDAIQLVTVAMPGTEAALQGLATTDRWQVVTGSRAQMETLVAAMNRAWTLWAHTDAGVTIEEFATVPAVVVIDQHQRVRGFWHDDSTGRGNAINAARLLVKHPEVDEAHESSGR